jgi:hybrid cluster-associated redox disulfide protein
MKITKKTLISEALEKKGDKAAKIFLENGLMCIFCPMSQQETIEQGCLSHGLEKKQIEKIIEKLNKLK